MKRKAFKTSPSVRIPRAVVKKMQQSKAQAQAQAQAQEVQLQAMGNAMEKAIEAYARRHKVLYEALRDAVKYIDRFRNSEGSWTVADVKRLEEIRLLSIGV